MQTDMTVIDAVQPIVTTQGSDVITNSRDVARYFKKEHRHVLDAIDKLLKDTAEIGVPKFRQGSYRLESTGSQVHRSFDMDRKAFTLLAMGFSGKKALAFKIRYIDAFDAMEAELQRQRPAIDPNDPSQLRALLIDYSERTIALQSRVSDLEPKERALDRIATAKGSLCITDAAKTLGMRPKALFAFLRGNGWIYRRGTSRHDRAYEDKLIAGLLEHKITTPDNQDRTFEQVRVTPNGLVRLSRIFSRELQLSLGGVGQ